MSLLDVHHQAHAQEVIQRALFADRMPHAYIFHGPNGVGKETLARGLAQALLCSRPVEEQIRDEAGPTIGRSRLRVGCGRCVDCRAVTAQTHPDLHMVYRQLNREHPDPAIRNRKALDIGVDVLRHFVIGKVGLTPQRGARKVFVVREAERITPQAQNALLKTLEEPPEDTVLILLVGVLDRLLPTTLSRCQVVRFDALPRDFVKIKLAELRPQLSPEQLEWYARGSEGSIGRAIEQADDGLFEVNQRVIEGLTKLAIQTGTNTGDKWIEEAKKLGDGYRKRDPETTDTEASRRGAKSILYLAANWYADLLRVGAGAPTIVVNAAWQSRAEQAAGPTSAKRAAEAISIIARAERQLDLNANTQLVIETLLADLVNACPGRTAIVT